MLLRINIYEALELKQVAPEFSVSRSILRGRPLILGRSPNLGRVPLLLAEYLLFTGLITLSQQLESTNS